MTSSLNETAPFWMVHGTGTPAPAYRHASEGDATREAERLARSNPGVTFVVLESVAAIRKVDIERINLRLAPSRGRRRTADADDIPF